MEILALSYIADCLTEPTRATGRELSCRLRLLRCDGWNKLSRCESRHRDSTLLDWSGEARSARLQGVCVSLDTLWCQLLFL